MSNITEMELQNLRHLLQFGEADEKKFSNYAQNAQDQNFKDFFQKSAQSATKNKSTLSQFLQ